jgi:hypothetical protein
MPSEEELRPDVSPDPLDPGHDPERYSRRLAAAERLILSHIQPLHDQGIIDLDAPARNVIDALDRQYAQPTDKAVSARAQEGIHVEWGGYWLVGDQGWCNHITASVEGE